MLRALLVSTTLLTLSTAAALAQGWERTYDLPGDAPYTLDSLTEADDAYLAYLSAESAFSLLRVDKASGERLSLTDFTPPPNPGELCVDTAGTAVGNRFFVRATAAGGNRVRVSRYERLDGCNTGQLRTAGEATIEVPDVDTVAVGGTAYDPSTGTVYITGAVAKATGQSGANAVRNRQVIVGLDARSLDLRRLELSEGFDFFVPFLESSLVAIVPGARIYTRAYYNDRAEEALFRTELGEGGQAFTIAFAPTQGVCEFDATPDANGLLRLDYIDRCYGKCDALRLTTFLDGPKEISFPVISTCQGSPADGGDVDIYFPTPDTGIAFTGTFYGVDSLGQRASRRYYQKQGGSGPAWQYLEDSTSTFSPNGPGLGTRDGGAVFSSTVVPGELTLRKFDATGSLTGAPVDTTVTDTTTRTPARVDLALSELLVAPDTVRPGGVLTYSFTLANLGDTAADANFTVLGYLSTDPALSADDVQDGRIESGSFAAGARVERVGGASTIPADLAAGDYYLIVVADGDGAYAEPDEANNVAVGAFTVAFDSVVSDTTVVDTTIADTTVAVASLRTLGFELGPNPTAGPLTVSLPADIVRAEAFVLFDPRGRRVVTGVLEAGANTLELSALPAGVYTLWLPRLQAGALVLRY